MEMETLHKHADAKSNTDRKSDRTEKDTQQTYHDCEKYESKFKFHCSTNACKLLLRYLREGL